MSVYFIWDFLDSGTQRTFMSKDRRLLPLFEIWVWSSSSHIFFNLSGELVVQLRDPIVGHWGYFSHRLLFIASFFQIVWELFSESLFLLFWIKSCICRYDQKVKVLLSSSFPKFEKVFILPLWIQCWARNGSLLFYGMPKFLPRFMCGSTNVIAGLPLPTKASFCPTKEADHWSKLGLQCTPERTTQSFVCDFLHWSASLGG